MEKLENGGGSPSEKTKLGLWKADRYRWVVLIVYMYVAALTQLYWLNFTAIDTYLEDNLHIPAMSIGFLALVFRWYT
jgi:hypothetical protein